MASVFYHFSLFLLILAFWYFPVLRMSQGDVRCLSVFCLLVLVVFSPIFVLPIIVASVSRCGTGGATNGPTVCIVSDSVSGVGAAVGAGGGVGVQWSLGWSHASSYKRWKQWTLLAKNSPHDTVLRQEGLSLGFTKNSS